MAALSPAIRLPADTMRTGESILGLVSTLAIMAAAIGIFALALVVTRRPTEPGRPRMVPWVGVQMVCVLVAVFMLAHLVSLITGTPLIGRRGY
jgi:ABC-type branched-subunit amino acid transport system permease subunit